MLKSSTSRSTVRALNGRGVHTNNGVRLFFNSHIAHPVPHHNMHADRWSQFVKRRCAYHYKSATCAPPCYPRYAASAGGNCWSSGRGGDFFLILFFGFVDTHYSIDSPVVDTSTAVTRRQKNTLTTDCRLHEKCDTHR